MDILEVIGITSIISVIVSYIFDLLKNRHYLKFEKITTEKESRYRSILVFMMVVLDENNLHHVSTEFKPNSNQDVKAYYLDELRVHLKFSRLYASMNVLNSIENFISSPTEYNFDIVANEMRNDLWASKIKNRKKL